MWPMVQSDAVDSCSRRFSSAKKRLPATWLLLHLFTLGQRSYWAGSAFRSRSLPATLVEGRGLRSRAKRAPSWPAGGYGRNTWLAVGMRSMQPWLDYIHSHNYSLASTGLGFHLPASTISIQSHKIAVV